MNTYPGLYKNHSLVGFGSFGAPVDCTANPYDPACTQSQVVTQDQFQTSMNQYLSSPWFTVYKILSIVGATTGAYHGYRRNDSVGWAIGWFLLGGAFPFITIPVSLAEGYAKPHSKRVIVDK